MLWDLIQHSQIGQARRIAENARFAATDAHAENRSLKDRLENLEATLERVSLAAMALAEIVHDHLGVTQAEIEAKVQEIDLRDGKLDGRLQKPHHDCDHCHHTNSAHRTRCLYCGEALPASSGLFASPINIPHPE